jgi:hypothetical protein
LSARCVFAWTVVLLAGRIAPAWGGQAPGSSRVAEVPDITVSLAVGSHFRTQLSTFSGPGTETFREFGFRYDEIIPVLSASVQLPLGHSILLDTELMRNTAEGEFVLRTRIIDGVGYGALRPSDCEPPRCTAFVEQTIHEARKTTSLGIHALARFGTPRIASFAGGGVGLHRTTGGLSTSWTCQAIAAGGCNDLPEDSARRDTTLKLKLHAILGGELVVVPRVAAFATFRLGGLGAGTPYDEDDLAGATVTAGVRIALRTRPAR